MEVVVHGTKQGYKGNFIPNFQPSFALGDIRNGVNNEYPLGKSAYSLAFINKGCVFTKYTIVRDTLRSYAIGTVAFSLFLHANRELSGKGADVKSLLDKLTRHYIDNYVRDNNINRGEIPLIQEDWSFVQNISSEYTEIEKSRKQEEITSGKADPAFHYYNSDSELIEYLNDPFLEEYSDYKQILFIDSNSQGASNPINVLKNSGVKVNPDLKNEYYYLNNYDSTKGVKITANDKPRSDGKGYNQIRAKWKIEIKYSKEYYKPIKEKGSISDPDSDIYKYLEINGSNSNIRIKYDAFLPDPETKTFTFDVITKKDGIKVTNAEIQVDTQLWSIQSEVTFTAEDLGREHTISARKGDLFSEVIKITPKYYSAASIPLALIEKKSVKIKATDEENGDDIFGFKVHITGKDFYKVKDTIEFIGDEIDEKWNIQIEKQPEYRDSKNKEFWPAKDGDVIKFELKKETKQKTLAKQPTDQDEEKQKSFTTKLKAIFSKPAFIATSIVSLLILVIGIWALYSYFIKDNQLKESLLIDQQAITNYLEGDSLMLDKLNVYKENWGGKAPNFIEKNDSAKWKSDWKPTDDSLNRAIKKRKLINIKNFSELRDLHYYDGQSSFKAAIDNIDSSNYKEVSNRIGNVSDFTLTQIAKMINEILKPKEPAKEEKQQEPKREASKKNERLDKEPHAKEQKTPANNINSEITEYIKGSELKKETLIKYENTDGIDQNLKKSIQLCLKFWDLVGMGPKPYQNFRNKINADNNFNDSKLKAFLDKMCQTENPPYTKTDKINGLK